MLVDSLNACCCFVGIIIVVILCGSFCFHALNLLHVPPSGILLFLVLGVQASIALITQTSTTRNLSLGKALTELLLSSSISILSRQSPRLINIVKPFK